MENKDQEVVLSTNKENEIINEAYNEINNQMILDEQRRLRREKTYLKSAKVLKKENNIIIAIISFCVALIIGAIGYLTYSFINANNYIQFCYMIDNELVSINLRNSISISEVVPPYIKGHTFDGWYRDASLTIKVSDNYIIDKDTTLYPKYSACKYSVVFNSNNLENKSYKLDVDFNDYYQTLENPFTKPNYTFVGWSTDKNATASDDLISEYETCILKDFSVLYYAIWEGSEINLSFNLNNMQVNGEPYKVEDVAVNLGDRYKLPEIPNNAVNTLNPNYKFAGFKYGDNYYQSGEEIVINENASQVEAIWSDATGILLLSLNLPNDCNYNDIYNSIVHSSSENINRFSLPTLSDIDNYVFDGWNTSSDYTGINFNGSANFETSKFSSILYAKWKPAQKSIALINELANTTQVFNIDYMSSRFIPTPVSDKYEFKGWRLYKWTDDMKYAVNDDNYITMGGDFTYNYIQDSLLLFAHWERITTNVKIRNIDTLSIYTVDDYKHNIFEKLQVEDLIEYCSIYLVKDGYTIVGFTTDINNRTTVMDNVYVGDKDIVLYPVWQKD